MLKSLNKIHFSILCSFVAYSLCSKEISIAAYNVENLFDIQHDKGKHDWEFTPKGTPGKEKNCKRTRNSYFRKLCLSTNWNQKTLTAKMEALKESLTHGPYGIPDILILNEVENEKVFKEFNKLLGYDTFFITHSPDFRGIDNVVALNSSLGWEVLESKEIIVKGISTRNILKVRLKYDTEEFLIYAHHWPSQFNPSKNRMMAAEAFAQDLKREVQQSPSLFVISLGDFNVIEKDVPNSLKLIVEEELGLSDLHEYSQSSSPGSYFYRRENKWNRLDRIYVSKNLIDKKGTDYVQDSYAIGSNTKNSEPYVLKKRRQVSTISVPERFSFQGESFRGASDHYPVLMKLFIPTTADIQNNTTTQSVGNSLAFCHKIRKYLTNLIL